MLGYFQRRPSTFILYRGETLMDNNVLHLYATHSFQPSHLITRDQTESCWLHSLILQQGWKIEYTAIASKLIQSWASVCSWFTKL